MNDATAQYSHARGVESAIAAAARKAALADPALDTHQRIQLEYFNRFLCRIFSDGDTSQWVLKGGAGMLARVPSARSTRDIDLFRHSVSLGHALDDVRRLASIDLGDHFRFEYAGHEASIGTETQPYVDGCRVAFTVFVGVAKRGTVHVDIAVGTSMTAEVQTALPQTALDLPRLVHHRYRLYPVVDQIADKVCATMSSFDGRPSSREKDLVDIVVCAVTHDVDGAAQTTAIDAERRRRRMKPFEKFVVPPSWGRGYVKLSARVPQCAEFRTIESARRLASRFITPALSCEAAGKTWLANDLAWA